MNSPPVLTQCVSVSRHRREGLCPRRRRWPAFGDGYRFHVTGLVRDERGFPTTDSASAASLIDRIRGKVDDADVVVFAYGIVARAAREAVDQARARGLRVGLLRPVTLWPFPETAVAEIAVRVDTIIVAEMNLRQMRGEVERVVAGNARVVGGHRADGEPILPSEIFAALEQHLPDLAGELRGVLAVGGQQPEGVAFLFGAHGSEAGLIEGRDVDNAGAGGQRHERYVGESYIEVEILLGDGDALCGGFGPQGNFVGATG